MVKIFRIGSEPVEVDGLTLTADGYKLAGKRLIPSANALSDFFIYGSIAVIDGRAYRPDH